MPLWDDPLDELIAGLESALAAVPAVSGDWPAITSSTVCWNLWVSNCKFSRRIRLSATLRNVERQPTLTRA
jgi:hypothetical protein